MTTENQAPEGELGLAEAARKALEALETSSPHNNGAGWIKKHHAAKRALQTALAAQPEWRCPETGRTCTPEDCDASPAEGDAPTDEQIDALIPPPAVQWPKPMALRDGGSVSAATYYTVDQVRSAVRAALAAHPQPKGTAQRADDADDVCAVEDWEQADPRRTAEAVYGCRCKRCAAKYLERAAKGPSSVAVACSSPMEKFTVAVFNAAEVPAGTKVGPVSVPSPAPAPEPAAHRLLRECELFLRVLGLDSEPAAKLAAECRAVLAAPSPAVGAATWPTYEPTVVIDESRGRLTATGAAMEAKDGGRWVRLRDVLDTHGIGSKA